MVKRYCFALLLILLSCYKVVAQQAGTGYKIYNTKCTACHGKEGTKGFLGAANLQMSVTNDSIVLHIILAGKRRMPAYRDKLTSAEIEQLVMYVKSLRR